MVFDEPDGVTVSFFPNPFGVTPTPPISTEGLFFSFDALVLSKGAGSLSFGYVDATEVGSFFPLAITLGPPLDFTTVSAAVASVPEPSSLLALMGCVVCLAFAARRITRRLA